MSRPDDAVEGRVGVEPREADSPETDTVVVQGHNLKRYYSITDGPFKRHVGDVKAVDGVDFRIERGETLGLVGESGCGKSTLGRLLVHLDDPTEGHIYFDLPREDADEIAELEETPPSERTDQEERRLDELREEYAVGAMSKDRSQAFRRNAQIVFQNPSSSLNPRKLIRDTVSRPLELHTDLRGAELDERAVELLEQVGLGEDYLYRYPHTLSGGQKQRVAIARAIATEPDLVVLDEPSSALDVSVQAQILNLLNELQEELGLTYFCISHDLSVIRHLSDRVYVMYLGQIVERALRESLFEAPKHPYTEALLSSSPAIETDETIELEGDVPEPDDPPTGCRFHTRCHEAFGECGWSGRDLYSLVKRVKDTEGVASDLWEAIDDAEFDGFVARFELDGDADRFVPHLRGETDALEPYQPPLFEAVTDVFRDGDSIVVQFREVEPPALLEEGPRREVACYLYQ